MKTLLENKRFLHMCWLLLSCAILGLDHLSGPYVRFPILFVFPVALATWFSGRITGFSYALVLPVARFLLEIEVSKPWSPEISGINGIIQILTLIVFVGLIDYTFRQATELRILEGLLPICSRCKKIRDAHGTWVQLEEYLTEHSEVELTHGYCPDCMKKMWDQYHTDTGSTKGETHKPHL